MKRRPEPARLDRDPEDVVTPAAGWPPSGAAKLRRRLVALGVVVALVLAGAVTAAAGDASGDGATSAGPGAPPASPPAAGGPVPVPSVARREQQTFPLVIPRVARRHTAVALYFTLADAPGHQGVLATAYRVQVDAAPGARPACVAPPPPAVETGRRGEVVRVALPRPRGGWCVGRHRVTVFLERGPYCPDPGPGEPPRPCPLFASQELDVGHARFSVRGEDAVGGVVR